MVISREPSPISDSLRKGSTWSKVPLSATSSAWLAASGCKWKEQSSPSIFNTLKRSERGGSMVRLCYQWTFPPETFGHRTSLNFFFALQGVRMLIELLWKWLKVCIFFGCQLLGFVLRFNYTNRTIPRSERKQKFSQSSDKIMNELLAPSKTNWFSEKKRQRRDPFRVDCRKGALTLTRTEESSLSCCSLLITGQDPGNSSLSPMCRMQPSDRDVVPLDHAIRLLAQCGE